MRSRGSVLAPLSVGRQPRPGIDCLQRLEHNSRRWPLAVATSASLRRAAEWGIAMRRLAVVGAWRHVGPVESRADGLRLVA
jgi:hypothetical protein